jgi:hypothetical protein
MKDDTAPRSATGRIITRRTALVGAAQALAAISVVVIGVSSARAKSKAAKEDFLFQETPDESGKSCATCINFEPKATGQYGADSGDCELLEGDVCKHCYCQGWTDKNDPKSKKAGT